MSDLKAIDMATVESEFQSWWESDGQYCRAGGGDYEKTFAYRAYEAAIAKTNAFYADPQSHYTAVDMTTAAAEGFRDGQASVVVRLPDPDWSYENTGSLLAKDGVIAAIIAAGGKVKE